MPEATTYEGGVDGWISHWAPSASAAREVVTPRSAEVDRTDVYSWDYADAFRAAGLLGLSIPREHDGAGAGSLGLAVLAWTADDLTR